MDRELRIQKLKEIQTSEPYMTGIRIPYKGEKRVFSAFRIPISCLVYNKYNGRILSLVKSYEKQFHPLDAENEEDKKMIEKFLWDSREDRNNITMKDIAEYGQKVYGIVTSDGIIIDGNRRALILNKIYSNPKDWPNNDVTNCQYFIAVILPSDADRKEIMRLETTFQMGEDRAVDYNPIEKYLKCRDLKEIGFNEIEIASMMSQKESQIKEWLQIMKLMEDYLDYLGYNGIYTRLDKREDHFINLYNNLKKIKKEASWECDDLDINELKFVCFDHIRALWEGKDFRSISKPTNSIFCTSKDIWNVFLEEHKNIMKSLQEKTVNELIEEHHDEELPKVLEGRDTDWTKSVIGPMKGNVNKNLRKLDDLEEANKPLELAKRALSTLTSINKEANQLYEEPQVMTVLKSINKETWDLMQLIKKGRAS
jgi:hypothetical protein